MKRIAVLLLVLLFLIGVCSCKKKEPERVPSSMKVYTNSDLIIQNNASKKRIFAFDIIDKSGKAHITYYTWKKTDDGGYSFTRKENQYMDVTIDENTEILMGDIMNYDGKTSLSAYNKATSLDYLVENCKKKVGEKPLYFTAEISRGYVEKIELFWDYYFNN